MTDSLYTQLRAILGATLEKNPNITLWCAHMHTFPTPVHTLYYISQMKWQFMRRNRHTFHSLKMEGLWHQRYITQWLPVCGMGWWPSTHILSKKTTSYGYMNPHYKPKTVWRPSQVYNVNPYTNKATCSWWIEAPCSLPPQISTTWLMKTAYNGHQRSQRWHLSNIKPHAKYQRATFYANWLYSTIPNVWFSY